MKLVDVDNMRCTEITDRENAIIKQSVESGLLRDRFGNSMQWTNLINGKGHIELDADTYNHAWHIAFYPIGRAERDIAFRDIRLRFKR